MKRWASNLLCGVSLLVLLVCITLWVRSYSVGEDFNRKTWGGGRETFMSVGLSRGALSFFHFDECDPAIRKSGGWGWSYARYAPTTVQIEAASGDDRLHVDAAGLRLHWSVHPTARGWMSVLNVILPFWMFLPAAIPPALWWRRRKRRGSGFEVHIPADEITA